MTKKISIKYLLYFLSYLLVYPCSYPLLFMLAFVADNPTVSESTLDIIFYIFSLFVTVVGSTILNYLFKRSMKLKKNTKHTWLIFFAHLILIPLTYILIFP